MDPDYNSFFSMKGVETIIVSPGEADLVAVVRRNNAYLMDCTRSILSPVYKEKYFYSKQLLLFFKEKSEYLCVHSMTQHVCVCVFSSHSFWTSSSLDVPAGVIQEEGHTGFLIHLLSAVRALIFLARRIQPFLSLVDCEVESCVLTI